MSDIPDEFEPYMDLVQVRTADAFGSGLLVGPGIVLTSRHCIANPDQGWRPRDNITVCLWRELKGAGVPPAENEIDATIGWPRYPGEDGPEDLAVLVLQDKPEPRATWRYRSLGPGSEAAQARGFPSAGAGKGLSGDRIERNLAGAASNFSATQRTILFKIEAGLDDRTQKTWQGLSGGPLVRDGAIIGVMRQVSENLDAKQVLEAEMLALAIRSNNRLGRLLQLREAGRPPAPRPVPGGLNALHDVLHTLDRKTEGKVALQGIRVHEGNRSLELFVSGQPEDLCQHFWRRLWSQRLGRPAEPLRGARVADREPKPLPGKPPKAIEWPVTGGDPVEAESLLAQDAMSILLHPAQALRSGLRDDSFRRALEATPPPLWLCIVLPDAPTKFDRALLEQWRRAWSGLKLPPSVSAGYMLLYSGPLPRPKLYDFKPPAGNGLAQVPIQLEQVTAGHVLEWQYVLDEYWEEGKRRGPRLSELIPGLHTQYAGRPALRMSEVQALILGHLPRLVA